MHNGYRQYDININQNKTMNVNKIVRWNLTQPMEKRITAEQVAEKIWSAAHKREMRRIHQEIRAIVDVKIAEREALWNSL